MGIVRKNSLESASKGKRILIRQTLRNIPLSKLGSFSADLPTLSVVGAVESHGNSNGKL